MPKHRVPAPLAHSDDADGLKERSLRRNAKPCYRIG
jgi:hypothetical protein